MGEIADMMLDGILDMQTGEYLGEAVGYPRSREPWGGEHSDHNKIRGVTNYMVSKGFVGKKSRREALIAFFKTLGFESTSNISNDALKLRASDNFNKFVNFLKTYKC